MSDIVLSGSTRNNLLALKSTTQQQGIVQNRLATGKKVNSALDNPTSFFTAAGFDSRSNALTSLLDSMSNGVQTLQAANSGITSITKLVDQLRSATRQALQSANAYVNQAKISSTTSVTGASGADLRGTTGSVVVAGTKDFRGGVTVGAGNAGNLVVNGRTVALLATDTGADVIAKINTTSGIGVTASIDSATGFLKLSSNDAFSNVVVHGASDTPPSTAATLTGTGLAAGTTASTNPLQGKTLTFTTSSGATVTATFGDPAVTPGAVKSLDDFNTVLASVGLSASIDAAGAFTFTTTTRTASQTFSLSGTATGVGQPFGTTASTNPVRGGNGADARDGLITQYNGVLAQIDTLAKDAGFNGINLLTGDTLTLLFNESASSRLDIAGTAANSGGLGLGKVTAENFKDGDALNALLATIDRSSSQLQSQASRFGAQLAVTQTRQDFTKQLVNTLQVGADNLVNADLNEEGANLLALNTQQQLSQTALSLATQSAQAVLRLFQ